MLPPAGAGVNASPRLVVASASIAAIAMVSSTLLHELGHAGALRAAGVTSIDINLHSVAADASSLSDAAQAGVVLAGPAVSALLAIGAASMQRRARRRGSGILLLALLWTEVLAAAYLAVAVALAPLASSDAARLLALLSAPRWVALALVPIGIALLLLGVGGRLAHLARRAAQGRELALVASGWAAVLVSQALLLRSADWFAVAFMALSAIPALQRPFPSSAQHDHG